MGLLDTGDDPINSGLLSFGLRLMSTPGKFGQALGTAGLGALGDMRQARADMEQRKMREQALQMQTLQLQQAQREIAAQEQARVREEAFRKLIPDPQAQASQAALSGGGGPTLANAARIAPVDPRAQLLYQAMATGQIKPMDYLTTTQKDDAPVKLGEGETLLSGKASGYGVLARGMPKASDTPAAIREYQFAVNQGYKGTFQQFQLDQRRAGASNTTVTYGAPMAGVNSAGLPVFFQPDKGGGTPAIVPGITPPKKDNPVEFNKSVSGLKELANGLTSYETTLRESGGVNPLARGETRAALQGSYTSLQMGLKNAFELGALAGPDLTLLQGMIVDPTSPKAVILGTKGVLKQNEKVREYLRNRGRAVYEAHGMPVPPEYAAENMPSLQDAAAAELARRQGGR